MLCHPERSEGSGRPRTVLAGAALLIACGGPLITERRDDDGLTALMRAARAPDTTLLTQLIAKRADVRAEVPPRDLRDPGAFFSQLEEVSRATVGYTALHFAAQNRRVDNARILISHGAAATHRARYGVTPLAFAIRQDHVEMTLLLAKAGARPDPDLAGIAVGKGKPELVAALFENGANARQSAHLAGQSGFRPLLVIAAQRGNPAIVRTLLAAGADPSARDVYGWTAVRWAHEGKARKQPGAAEIIALLDSVGARDSAGVRAVDLAQALRRSDLAGVRAALKAGANPNARDETGLTPLIRASSASDAEIVRALVAAGATVDVVIPNSVTPLTAAIENGDVATARVLLDAGARGDQRDGRAVEPLFATAMHARGDIAALILRDTTIRPSWWHLNEAARKGDTTLVRLALDHGVSPLNEQRDVLASAASGCRARDNLPVIRLLLERGARSKPAVRAALAWSSPALHLAAGGCNPEVIRLLVQAGDSVNARDFVGATPLMYAASNGNADNVRVLIALGADVNARDENRITAFSRARSPEIKALLVAAGASQTPPRETPRTQAVRNLLARLW